jgi:hypothetical protein
MKYRPNDPVRIKATSTSYLRGPFTVVEVFAAERKYTLGEPNRTSVDNGKKFHEDELDHAS